MITHVPTICPYCGTGCSVNLIVNDGKIVGTTPNIRSPVNEGKLCPKGTYCHQFIHSPDRLKKPLVRKGDVFIETDWDTAYHLIAEKFRQYAPEEIGILASARCSNEDNYALMKFARGVLKTNNIDHGARQCHAATMTGLTLSFGMGTMTNSIPDIGESDCIFCLGSNTFEQHPLIGRQIIRAKAKGGRFIYADPRYTTTAIQADLFLQFYSGSDVAVLNCIMGEIIRNGLENREFIASRTREFESLKKVVLQNKYNPREVSQLTGVSRDYLIKAAEWIGKAKSCTVLYAMGLAHHSGGVNNVRAIANLMMLTGNIGRPGTGINALRGQNNVQGACDMGCLPDFFPGYQPVTDSVVHRKISKIWKFPDPIAPPRTGLDISQMFQKAGYKNHGIRAMFLVGENPMISEPDLNTVEHGIRNLDFLVVSDIFFTKTCEYASIVLPAACYAEKEGTVTNTERRVQKLHKAVEPPGIAKPDWQIITDIAGMMGYEEQFSYLSPADIFDEMALLCPGYHGITSAKLSHPDGVLWPCPSVNHKGTAILYEERFSHPDGKGVFCPVEWKTPSELPDSHYPFRLTTGRVIWHWHTGTMTRRSKNLADEVNEAYIEVHPADAASAGVSDGDIVVVRSRKGSLSCRIKTVSDIKEGVVFMPLLFDAALSSLTGKSVPESGTAEYKSVCVTFEPALTGDDV
ncbi:formate dehydrogenase subunit alpha [Methanospirillum stamsii]|uniref:Formate dehydrogenase subunit alpha n=1 Tax=Methanospirillum stamsii TaxID=1277351 RepID=A0A2V2NAX6_9EURY|nr:formate dehydrogenase subunit alpha [Methanospirillum stamsii]PWR72433.1 formate dehydrogenase subunit alpha [Methanospirillum stamsii]